MAHVQNHRLKIKSVASILVYVANGLSLIGAIALILGSQSHNLLEIGIGALINIVDFVLQIVAAVFALLLTWKLRKEYPTLIQDHLKLS